MEDVLRWSLLVLGSCIIVGVLVHGIWVSRKNREEKTTNKKVNKGLDQELQPNGWHTDEKFDDSDLDDMPNMGFSADPDSPIVPNEQFDDLGIGAVRVVSSAKPTAETTETEELTSDTVSDAYTKPTEHETSANVQENENTVETEPEVKPTASNSKIYASVVTQPKPEYAKKYQSLAAETVAISKEEKVTSAERQADSFNISKVSNSDLSPARSANMGPDNYQAPEPPPFLLKTERDEETEIAKESIQAEPVVAQHQPTKGEPSTVEKGPAKVDAGAKESLTEQAMNLVKRKKVETSRRRREPRIAEDQMRIDFDEEPAAQQEVKEGQPKQSPSTSKQEVLVLNVKVADGTSIAGAALLPMLLTLGFKFGDQDIFHRHVNSNGKGPVLFSLANMFKPGNFDIDNLENFTTQGVSLFMILPIEGDPHQVFNMMHNAARKIADEFSAQVYDGRRALLTKQSLQQYVEKIREFERQRIVNR